MNLNALEDRFNETIEKYGLLDGIKNIVFLFSGGKDCTLGLYLLDRYIKDKSLTLSLGVVTVTFPTHMYFENGRETENFVNIKKFWQSRGVHLNIFTANDRDVERCKQCKNVRKRFIDDFLKKHPKGKTAVATGYSLNDVLAYIDEYCLASNFTFDLSQIPDESTVNRIKNHLHKIKTKEELPDKLRIIRPLLVFRESDIKMYLEEKGIPYLDKPCRIGDKKHKRAYSKSLETVERSNKATYEGAISFLKKHNVKFPKNFDDIEYEKSFSDC